MSRIEIIDSKLVLREMTEREKSTYCVDDRLYRGVTAVMTCLRWRDAGVDCYADVYYGYDPDHARYKTGVSAYENGVRHTEYYETLCGLEHIEDDERIDRLKRDISILYQDYFCKMLQELRRNVSNDENPIDTIERIIKDKLIYNNRACFE